MAIIMTQEYFNRYQKCAVMDNGLYRRCTTAMAIYQFLLERLMTAQGFENVNIYVLLFKTRHLKPVATRHQLQGSIVYCDILISF